MTETKPYVLGQRMDGMPVDDTAVEEKGGWPWLQMLPAEKMIWSAMTLSPPQGRDSSWVDSIPKGDHSEHYYEPVTLSWLHLL